MPASIPPNAPHLKPLTESLRDLHRHLVDIVKEEYEQETGSKVDAAQLLQLLTKDQRFDWLHELSEFMVVVDELIDQDEISDSELQAIATQAKQLVAPAEGSASRFYQRYVGYLQHHPALTMSHAGLRKVLAQLQ